MKKITAMMLAAIMSLAMSAPAFADEGTTGVDPTEPTVVTEPTAVTEPTEAIEPTVTVAPAEITKEDALAIAFKNAKTSRSGVKRLEVELENGKYEIEFTKRANGTEFDYDILKSDGTIWKKSVDYRYKHNYSTYKIGKNQAIKKVAKRTGISSKTIKRGTFHFERDDGEGKYEIKFKYNGKRYEYEMLAATGKVTEYQWVRVR